VQVVNALFIAGATPTRPLITCAGPTAKSFGPGLIPKVLLCFALYLPNCQ
jgi:hypothetical protein